jgi:segregation and condensation protein B
VTKALRRLASDYRRRNTSLEVVKVGSRWTMQVRTEYTPTARSVATPEVDPKYLRTLALIAYHQPVLQSDLQQMMGPKVYDHVRELKGLGLVNARRRGATLELTTTQRFPEYFGIASAKREDIKRFMAERAGIELEPPAPPAGEAGGAPEPEDAQEAGETAEPGEAPEPGEPEGPATEAPGADGPVASPDEDQV